MTSLIAEIQPINPESETIFLAILENVFCSVWKRKCFIKPNILCNFLYELEITDLISSKSKVLRLLWFVVENLFHDQMKLNI